MNKVVYKDNEYSQAALAELLNISKTTLKKYLDEAKFSGEDFESIIERNCRTYQYNGNTYKSFSELSDATEINRKTLTRLIKENPDKTIDEIALEYKNGQKIYTYGEKTYTTIEQVANELGLSKKTISKFLQLAQGNLEKAIELYEKEHTYAIVDGVRYISRAQLAQSLGVSYITLKKYIEEEGSLQVAIEKIKSKEVYIWRGKTYGSLESVSREMGIPRNTIARILENEAGGDLEQAYNIYQGRNKGKYRGYTINGKSYSSKKAALEDLGISYRQYYSNQDEESAVQFEERVNSILKEREEKELERQNVELKKKQREEERQEEQRQYTYKGEEIHTILELSSRTGISKSTLQRMLDGYKKGSVDGIIQDYLDSKIIYTYDNNSFDSIRSLAEYTGINELRLGRYIRKYDRDAEKALFMIRLMDSKREKAQNLLDNSENNEENKEKSSRNTRIMYDETKSLHQYCIENKINYSCIYYAIRYLGKTKEEALENYKTNGQEIPTKWIYERYGILLKHLLINEGINYNSIISDMRDRMISLEEALANYIIKDEAKKSDNDPDWQMEMYPILTSDYISEDEKLEFRREFFVSDNEMESLNKAKDRVTKMKRKILLYEIAECFENSVYPENEMIDILREYKITEQEIDTIFLDLYSNFYEGVRLSEGEELFQERQRLNDYIRNYDSMTREERIALAHNRPQDIEYIKKVSSQINFYKSSVRTSPLTGQDIGKIGYTANVRECDDANRKLSFITEDRVLKEEDMDDYE